MKHKRRTLWVVVRAMIVWMALLTSQSGHTENKKDTVDAPRRWEFDNGRWYDGHGFHRKTWYSVDGRLTHIRPQQIDQTVDLKGEYVVPPLADAHCHHFDGAYNAPLISRYLQDGVFYAQSMGNWIQGRDAILPLLNRPDSVDVTFANAGLTSTLGHPFLIYELLANPTANPTTPAENLERVRYSRKGEGKVYFFVDNRAMLDAIWPQYLASKPDLVKIFLLDSANYERHRAEAVPGQSGLSPQMAAEIVSRAHAAGLRVYAHIETAYDFHVAVAAGVDGLAHMAGYAMGQRDGKEFLIAESDAKELGARNGVVQPTASLASGYVEGDREALARVQEIQRRNLRLLRRCGVRIAIGSDHYGEGPWREAEYLQATGLLAPRDLLRSWVQTTPETIFPKRKIGRFAEGYEASFLVVRSDPSRDIRSLHHITLRFKQGRLFVTALTEHADDRAQHLLQEVSEATTDLHSLTADIELHYQTPGRSAQHSTGKVQLMRPNYALVTLEGVPTQTLASDGASRFLLDAAQLYTQTPADLQGKDLDSPWWDCLSDTFSHRASIHWDGSPIKPRPSAMSAARQRRMGSFRSSRSKARSRCLISPR